METPGGSQRMEKVDEARDQMTSQQTPASEGTTQQPACSLTIRRSIQICPPPVKRDGKPLCDQCPLRCGTSDDKKRDSETVATQTTFPPARSVNRVLAHRPEEVRRLLDPWPVERQQDVAVSLAIGFVAGLLISYAFRRWPMSPDGMGLTGWLTITTHFLSFGS